MPNKAYSEAVNWLFQQFPSYQTIGSKAYKPTLENTSTLITKLSLDLSQLNFVHVAGSNGKGSVCCIIASCTTAAGQKTGLFTSPHIHDFRERIRINGEMIAQEEVIRFVEKIKSLQLDFSPSFFEISFTMALDHFINNQCDICVIETGLGGRLDATNVIDPLISVITTISLEHQQFLGDTLEKIAVEKAGIIKSNKPVVLGESLAPLLPVFQKKCKELNADLIISSVSNKVKTVKLPFIQGSYQEQNFHTAHCTLEVMDKHRYNTDVMQKGINNLFKNTGYRGRLQLVSEDPRVIIDAAHNAEGIQKTLEAIQQLDYKHLHIIFGSSNDKDHTDTLRLLPTEASYYFTAFEHDRSAKEDQLKSWFGELSSFESEYFENPFSAYQSVLNKYREGDLIVILGSIFLLDNFFSFFRL